MASGPPTHTIRELRPGDKTKSCPFTVVIVANPILESPLGSGAFVIDPITSNQTAFDTCASYVVDCLFGALAGQAEQLLNDPAIGLKVRVVSLFVPGLAVVDANSLVAEDSSRKSDLVMTRRIKYKSFLAGFGFGLAADVAFAVTGSTRHTRASAYFTTDDDGKGGVPFTLDGVQYHHQYENLIPGTVALPMSSRSLTALHEFSHALSSYSNGMVVDLYVDDGPGLNSKPQSAHPRDVRHLQ